MRSEEEGIEVTMLYAIMVRTNFHDYKPLMLSKDPTTKDLWYELPEIHDSIEKVVEIRQRMIENGTPEIDIFVMAQVEV